MYQKSHNVVGDSSFTPLYTWAFKMGQNIIKKQTCKKKSNKNSI